MFWHIRPLIEVIGAGKNLLRLLKADATVRIGPQPLTLARIEVKAHSYNSYTISWEKARENARQRVSQPQPANVIRPRQRLRTNVRPVTIYGSEDAYDLPVILLSQIARSEYLRDWLFRLGGPGMILLGISDTTPFFYAPGSADVCLILLAAHRPEWWAYYALMTTVGEVAGGVTCARNRAAPPDTVNCLLSAVS